MTPISHLGIENHCPLRGLSSGFLVGLGLVEKHGLFEVRFLVEMGEEWA